jgi:mono/diheme cytochrome c family protein
MKKILVWVPAGMLSGPGLLLAKSAGGGEYDKGKRLYGDKCQLCHGKKGDGKGPAAASLNPRPTDFTRPEFWEQSTVEKIITDTIREGHGPMPAFELKPDEIKAIIDYMSHTFK